MRAMHMENTPEHAPGERSTQPEGCGRSRAAAKLGLRPLSASRTLYGSPLVSDPLVRGLAPDPVSWWKRGMRRETPLWLFVFVVVCWVCLCLGALTWAAINHPEYWPLGVVPVALTFLLERWTR